MKKIIIALILLTMLSCKKQGHMYRANYTTPPPLGKNPNDLSGRITTNFFFMNEKDSIEAVNWYMKTEAYKDIITKCDSFWITYECSADEWNSHSL